MCNRGDLAAFTPSASVWKCRFYGRGEESGAGVWRGYFKLCSSYFPWVGGSKLTIHLLKSPSFERENYGSLFNGPPKSKNDVHRGGARSGGPQQQLLPVARQTSGRDDGPCYASVHAPQATRNSLAIMSTDTQPSGRVISSMWADPSSRGPREPMLGLKHHFPSRLKSSRATSAETLHPPACHPARGAQTQTPPSHPHPPQRGAQQSRWKTRGKPSGRCWPGCRGKRGSKPHALLPSTQRCYQGEGEGQRKEVSLFTQFCVHYMPGASHRLSEQGILSFVQFVSLHKTVLAQCLVCRKLMGQFE